MFLIGIVVFYLLYTRCASIVGSFIHETNADIECEMKNMNGEVDG